jgi:hypothetical protein
VTGEFFDIALRISTSAFFDAHLQEEVGTGPESEP